MDEMDRLFRQSDFSAENEGLGTRIWNRVIRRKEEPVIMPIHKNEITEEMMMQAMQCKDADELIALARTGGYEITKEEAETYMAELEDFELEDEQIEWAHEYIDAGADIVIGSRFVTVEKPRSARMAGSSLLQAIIRLTTGQKVADPTSGMRLYNARMIEAFANTFDFGPEPDTIALLMRRGAKVAEVQVTMHERKAGTSYLTMSKSIMYMLSKSFSILFAQWFRGRK